MPSFSVPLLAAAVIAASSSAPLTNGSPVALAVVPAIGSSAHYRLTRTLQGTPAPETIVSDVTLRRRTATALTLEGTIAGQPSDVTVLNLSPDGTLAIPKNDKTSSQNVALVEVVGALNAMSQVFASLLGPPRDGWTASLALSDLRSANANVLVPIVVANANPTDFDLHGAGELLVQPPQSQNGGSRGGGHHGGFHGGFGGGGFPGGGGGYPGSGGGGPGGGSSGGDSAGSDGPPGGAPGGGFPGGPGRQLNVAVAVDGRVRHGALNKLSIFETRSITLDSMPFVNVSGWTLEVLVLK
jgi:hypothetical protein